MRPRDRELLRELADGGLIDRLVERAELRLFEKFKNASETDRWHLGVTCDALKAVTVELQKAVNEVLRDDRPDTADAD